MPKGIEVARIRDVQRILKRLSGNKAAGKPTSDFMLHEWDLKSFEQAFQARPDLFPDRAHLTAALQKAIDGLSTDDRLKAMFAKGNVAWHAG